MLSRGRECARLRGVEVMGDKGSGGIEAGVGDGRKRWSKAPAEGEGNSCPLMGGDVACGRFGCWADGASRMAMRGRWTETRLSSLLRRKWKCARTNGSASLGCRDRSRPNAAGCGSAASIVIGILPLLALELLRRPNVEMDSRSGKAPCMLLSSVPALSELAFRSPNGGARQVVGPDADCEVDVPS